MIFYFSLAFLELAEGGFAFSDNVFMRHVIQGWSEGLIVTKFVKIMGLGLNMARYNGIRMTR